MSDRAPVLATLDGYAVEGGLDGPGEPATCFSPTLALGRHGPGGATHLWQRYEEVIDLVAPLGLDGLRLSLEWARIEPRRGQVDEAALGRYRDLVTRARSRGLAVRVVLVQSTWPAWAGQEAWLLPWVGPAFLEHAARVIDALEGTQARVAAFADPAGLVSRGFLEGSAPPWRRDAVEDASEAREQVARLARAVDSAAGQWAAPPWLEIGVGDPGLEAARRGGAEVHLRSLVSGSGPSAPTHSLLEPDGTGWRVAADLGLRRG